MKNNVRFDRGICEELTLPSTENRDADLGRSKMTSEDINKEDNTEESIKKVKMKERNAEGKKQRKEEVEGDVKKDDLPKQSEDDGKRNTSKQKKEIENSRDDKITSYETNVPQCLTIGDGEGMQEVHKDAVPHIVTAGEGATHQFSSLEKAEENDGMNDVTINNEEKEDDEKGKQKEIERLKDDKAEAKNLHVNISTGKKEKEGKSQPVMSTLAVPSTKHGHDSREKKLLISEPLGSTEVKITIEQEEQKCDNNEDDDRDISSNDLLCFAWQIAQGMVSKLCNERRL